LESIPNLSHSKDDKNSIELHIEAQDKNNQPCEVSRVKYIFG